MSDKPWFKAEADEMGRLLQSQVQQLELSPQESTRRQNLLYDLELYYGRPVTTLYSMTGTDYDSRFNPDQLVFNVAYSIVNTIRNRICSFRARAQFLPNGGDYLARRGARDRTAMSDAWAQEQGYQSEASFMLRDMLTGDGGVLKMYKDSPNSDGKATQVAVGRFPPWEFLFDATESLYRLPECAYHVTYLPIDQAEARFKIDRASLVASIVSAPPGLVYSSSRDLVRVVEGWRRGPDGRRALVIGDKVHGAPEDWQHDGFPLIQRTFDEGAVGVWGPGAITPIRGIQLELNEMQDTLREAFKNSAVKYVFYQNEENGQKLLTNAYVQGVPYTNIKPEINVPPAIHPSVYQYIEVLKKQAYETLGVSPFIAAGQKSPGADSAVAMREESELQSDRLANLSQVWEGIRTEAATWWNRFSVEIARTGVEPKWKAIHRGAFKELVFGNLDAEWQIQPFPSSVFGQNISGRLDRAVTLIKGGFMSKEDAMKALDLPDLAPIVDQMLAQSYLMEYLVDDILEEGVYRQPDRYIDPTALFGYAKNRYFLAMSDGSKYPEDHMAKLRRLLDTTETRLPKPAAPAPAPVGPADPALAGASPELLAAGGMPAAA